MRSLLFSMLLFALCLLVTSSAQQNDVTTYANTSYTHTDSIPPPNMPKVLIDIARITKFVYTLDTAFEYEKRDTALSTQ